MKLASVIIPNYNNHLELIKSVESLTQNNKGINFEIIIVDNGSTVDQQFQQLEIHKNVLIIKELNHLGSPYSCRNRGIENSSGDIIIFLDATCIPDSNWLTNGTTFLEESKADLISGNCKFLINEQSNLAEMLDSLLHVQIERTILEQNAAPTANLFVKRGVINKIGLFPEGVRSGADIEWTKKATNSGLTLKYSKDTVVYKYPRSYIKLILKRWRISKAHPQKWENQGRQKSLLIYLKSLIKPANKRYLQELINESNNQHFKNLTFQLYILYYFINLIGRFGHFTGYIRLQFKKF
jgi:glycosyltransferase involved in cell wall biosynthesis